MLLLALTATAANAEPPSSRVALFFWNPPSFHNFGDYLSLKLVERIVGQPVPVWDQRCTGRKLLAIGSILAFARDGDIVWGSGQHGGGTKKSDYPFTKLDVRAVRGPLTRAFLRDVLGVPCPAVYGDPALLIPWFFPEFKRAARPKHEYIVLLHYADVEKFPKNGSPNIVYATDPWDQIIARIVDSKLVISSSLHGIVVAEAFGVPARFLRVSETEALLKYRDYYLGTGRAGFRFARTVDEARALGGEPPAKFDPVALYEAFPFELWPAAKFKRPDFSRRPWCQKRPSTGQ